jgi:hypothetical protein
MAPSERKAYVGTAGYQGIDKEDYLWWLKERQQASGPGLRGGASYGGAGVPTGTGRRR